MLVLRTVGTLHVPKNRTFAVAEFIAAVKKNMAMFQIGKRYRTIVKLCAAKSTTVPACWRKLHSVRIISGNKHATRHGASLLVNDE